MNEEEIRELYEERVAIMLEGNSRDNRFLDQSEVIKRIKRAAYFDVKRRYGIRFMPKSIRFD